MSKPIEVITYIDSNIINQQTEEVAKTCTITAVGFVVKETDEYVTLSRELIDEEYRGQIAIPKIAITERKEVKP